MPCSKCGFDLIPKGAEFRPNCGAENRKPQTDLIALDFTSDIECLTRDFTSSGCLHDRFADGRRALRVFHKSNMDCCGMKGKRDWDAASTILLASML